MRYTNAPNYLWCLILNIGDVVYWCGQTLVRNAYVSWPLEMSNLDIFIQHPVLFIQPEV